MTTKKATRTRRPTITQRDMEKRHAAADAREDAVNLDAAGLADQVRRIAFDVADIGDHEILLVAAERLHHRNAIHVQSIIDAAAKTRLELHAEDG